MIKTIQLNSKYRTCGEDLKIKAKLKIAPTKSNLLEEYQNDLNRLFNHLEPLVFSENFLWKVETKLAIPDFIICCKII